MARPTTLAGALTQLEHLSARLSLATTLFHQHTGKDLTPLLDAALPATAYLVPALPRAPPAPPLPPAPIPTSAAAAQAADPSTAAEAEPAADAFDISHLVLKALGIGRAVRLGEVEDGEGAVAELVAGLPVTDEQREQLRAWAGL